MRTTAPALFGLGDVVDDRLAVDRERHRAPLVDVLDHLDVEAVVIRAKTRVGWYVSWVFRCGMSDGGMPVVLTSTSPAANDCTAVVPSVMILPFTA